MDASRRLSDSGTLGAVLYAGTDEPLVPEEEWIGLVGAVAGGDPRALRELYERTHRIVFTLAVRLTRERETAEELTVDVFHEVWRRAAHYDAAAGTVVGWIMNIARSRSIDRLRHDRRLKRVRPVHDDPLPVRPSRAPDEVIERREDQQLLSDAMAHLTPSEREAIQVAFFSELSYAETASRLDVPVGTIKTRIRSGLGKLRRSLGAKGMTR